MVRCGLPLLLWLWLPSALADCERLQASLTYTQEQAPRDLSGLLPVVVERVNRVLDGVVDVEVEWTGGDLHGRVGEHMVQCRVTRLASATPGQNAFADEEGRQVTSQCFHVPFTILDTNECQLPLGHAMRHQCHSSALCVNTIGSYECVCPGSSMSSLPTTADSPFWEALAKEPRGPWQLSLNSSASCPSVASTHGCCPAYVHVEDQGCRAAFRCPKDPCSSTHQCASNAQCQRASDPLALPNYSCTCPDGLMGNGRRCKPNDPKPTPKVKFDGVTPTEETRQNDYYCGCTEPIIDVCDGFPPCKGKHEVCTVRSGNTPQCACKPGYVRHETYGCVDKSPPVLKLKNDQGDQILRLKQGDVYVEHAVDILDVNKEEYLRSLKIAYSHPLPNGCLTQIGEFHVNYTIATPWTSPPYVRITRRVIIEDIDECSLDAKKYEVTCPELVPKCDVASGAKCVNTIGSYSCQCPKFTTGDGFLSGLGFAAGKGPKGFVEGNGCHDTSKPVIELVGPNPKVFRVCGCGGLNGILRKNSRDRHSSLQTAQQSTYSDEIKEMIRSTAGAELCATHQNSSPQPVDCVNAYDETYRGKEDLSSKVVVGEPVQKSAHRWSVPYDVSDAAGNVAETVWRDVVVEELELGELERKIRAEVLVQKDAEIKAAVSKAIEEDRRKNRRTTGSASSRNCPACPKCECKQGLDIASCEEYCSIKAEQCAVNADKLAVRVLLFMESIFPPSTAPYILLFVVLAVVLQLVRFVATLIFNRSAYTRTFYAGDRPSGPMLDPSLYNDPSADAYRSMPMPSSTRQYPVDNGFMSPRSEGFLSPSSEYGVRSNGYSGAASIYEESPVITPSRRGDGVRRRSPFPPSTR